MARSPRTQTVSLNDLRHPILRKFFASYELLLSTYEGGPEYLSENTLFRHPRETDDDYRYRLKQAFFTNYLRPIVELYVTTLFGTEEGIARDAEDPAYAQWLADVDTCGNTIDTFMREVAINAMLYGWTLIGVDMTPLEESISGAQARANGILPYFAHVCPLHVLSWGADKQGRFLWLSLIETPPDSSTPKFSSPAPSVRGEETWIRTWTRHDWQLQTLNGDLLASGEHALGEVPFVIAYYQKHLKYSMIGSSFCYDLARINRAIVNVYSYIDELLAKGSFPFLSRAFDPSSPPQAADMKALSQSNFLEYPLGSSPPSYVSIPTNVADYMKSYISEMMRSEIYRVAKLEYREAAVAQSGVAKLADFQGANAAIASFADQLERAEIAAMRLWAKWLGTAWDGMIDYPENFSVQPLADALQEATLVRGLYGDASPRFVAEHLYRLMTRLSPKMTDEERENFYEELVGNLMGTLQNALFGERLNQELLIPTEETPAGTELPVENVV